MEHTTSHASTTKRAAHQPPSLTYAKVLAIKEYFPLHSYPNEDVCRLLDISSSSEKHRLENPSAEALPIRGTDKEKYWQSTNDVPNLKIFMTCMAQRQEEHEETRE